MFMALFSSGVFGPRTCGLRLEQISDWRWLFRPSRMASLGLVFVSGRRRRWTLDGLAVFCEVSARGNAAPLRIHAALLGVLEVISLKS
jgi:hypothetical protein